MRSLYLSETERSPLSPSASEADLKLNSTDIQPANGIGPIRCSAIGPSAHQQKEERCYDIINYCERKERKYLLLENCLTPFFKPGTLRVNAKFPTVM